VVRNVTVTYPYGWFTRAGPGGQEVTRADIQLSVMDSRQNGGWCNLSLLLIDIQELRLFEPDRGYNTVLSDGLKLAWFDNLVFVDFSIGDYDLSQVDGFRKARRYVAARELYWRVEPFDR
jgi:hypothetical protein